MSNTYQNPGPTRAEIDSSTGPIVLEFGEEDCGFCRAARPAAAEALAKYPGVNHIKVEDGRGRPLGRSFRVKLWPTFIFLKDGVELARAVRPGDAGEILAGLEKIVP